MNRQKKEELRKKELQEQQNKQDRFRGIKAGDPHPMEEKWVFCASIERVVELEKDILSHYVKRLGSSPVHIVSTVTQQDFADQTFPLMIRLRVFYSSHYDLHVGWSSENAQSILNKLTDAYGKIDGFMDDEYLFHENEHVRNLAAHPVVRLLKEQKDKK